MKRYSSILLFGLVSLFLWSCTKESAVDPNNGSNKEMRVVASVLNTRAGIEDVTDIKAFMLDVKSGGNSKYDYYVAVKPDGIGWKSYNVAADGAVGAAKQMLWADATSPVVATALYLANSAETVLSADKYINAEINVVKNQTTEDAVKQCDYLYMPAATIYPTTDNGAVNVAFKHLMAKLNIMLYMGTEFNVNPGTDVNPVTEIKINGVSTKKMFDALSNSWKDAAGNTATEVMPYCAQYSAGSGLIKRATATYEAILIPETIEPGTFGLSITVNGKTYNWTSEQAIWLESNYSYSIPVTVGKNFVSVGNVQVAEWNAGAELNDGETDASGVKFSIPADQTAGVEAADLVYDYIPNFIPQDGLDENSAINITLKHCLVKLALNISKNNEFDGTTVTVESVLLRQTAGAVKLNLQQDGAVSVHGDAQAIDVMMHSLQGGSYEAIFFPYLGQEAGAKMITVNMSNGNSYSYTVPAEGINFEAGCAYTMNLKVGKDKLNLSGVSIGSWEFEENELNGGEAED